MKTHTLAVVVVLLLFPGCVETGTETKTSTPPAPTATLPPTAPLTPSPTTVPPPSLDDTIKIASFNVQVFGKTKAENPEVMYVLAKTVRNFDIVAVQEIRDTSGAAVLALRDTVNALGGARYEFVISERLGRTASKEQYAYLYNTQTVQLLQTYTYPEPYDVFHREPFVASFKAKMGSFDFVLIAVHTDPDEATQEINALPEVVEDARARFQSEGDFIVLGDLNADCSYFNENALSLLRSVEYTWLIENSADTTTGATNCTYDRIIITQPASSDYAGKAGVFKFDSAYNLSPALVAQVSDHYPVYAEFWANKDAD